MSNFLENILVDWSDLLVDLQFYLYEMPEKLKIITPNKLKYNEKLYLSLVIICFTYYDLFELLIV
jgi:hypothetical protein